MIAFEVDGAVVGYERPGLNRAKNRFTPNRSRAFRDHVARRFTLAHPGFKAMPHGTPVSIVVCLDVPMPPSWSGKKRDALRGCHACGVPDLDNIAKNICDALNGLAWADDRQIADLRVIRRWALVPNTVIVIEELDGGTHG